MNLQTLIPFTVVVVMIAIVVIASGYPYIQAKLSILFSGTLVLVLALVQLAREIRLKKRETVGKKEEHREAGQDTGVVQYLGELSWLLGFGLTISLLGFYLAIPLFICAYMKSHGSPWAASILTGALMAVFCYVVFVLVLEMKLHPGTIFIQLGAARA